jgi:hypothetical protein
MRKRGTKEEEKERGKRRHRGRVIKRRAERKKVTR